MLSKAEFDQIATLLKAIQQAGTSPFIVSAAQKQLDKTEIDVPTAVMMGVLIGYLASRDGVVNKDILNK